MLQRLTSQLPENFACVADIEETYTLTCHCCSMSHVKGYPLQGRMGYGEEVCKPPSLWVS